MTVVVAEKPSVARELAAFLGASARREGYFEGGGYRVTWALGHLVTLKEPQDYDPALKRWSLERLPFVPESFELKPLGGRGFAQLKVVKGLLRDAEAIICATDAGREGELIFRYIQEWAGCTRTPARRLWLSSLTREAIREAFAHLRPLSEYDRLYAAARCRSEADWVVGLNATRSYTVRNRKSGILWSVGRVQTPVLALIVGRDEEIRTFRPEPFWELLTRYRGVLFRFAGDRFPREEAARELLGRVQDRPFSVHGVDRRPERVPPPQLYDLTDLQRDMNRRYGLSADATLKAAQGLYEAKLISYPRTDSRYIGNDLKAKIPGIFEGLRALKPAEVGRLDLGALPFTGRIINDAKVSDHHAILPTGKAPGALSPVAQKVHDAVVTRLIAAFYPPCAKEVTTVNGLSNGVPFRARGVRVVEPGWTALYPRKADEAREDEQELPAFRPGESGPHEPTVRRGETSPPKPYTEGTLLGAMETAGKLVDDEELREALKERGLGTPATRAAIIETLLERGYVAREGKAVRATDLGRYLIALIRDRSLRSAELTGEWEARLREVERGRLEPSRFMDEIVRYTRDVIRSGEPSPVDATRLGDCPRCGRPVIAGKRDYGCSGWREGCRFVLHREQDGRALVEDDVRALLQQRLLRREGEAGEVVLHLTDAGTVAPIPVPKGKPFAPRGKGPRGGRREPRPAAAAAAGGVRVRGRRTASKPKSKAEATPAEGAAQPFASPALGACPRCGKDVVEGPKSFGCSGWRDGCKFAIWKTIAGKTITVRTAQALIKKGKSPLLKGFASRSGKSFDARLKLDGDEVRFDFGG
jgi:DNA topoisomerase-3